MAVLFRFGLWLAARFSPSQAYRIAGGLARLMRHSNTAKVSRINLRACYPELSDAEIDALCQASVQHMVLLFFELGQLRFWPQERLLANIQIAGQDTLEAAFQKDNGVLLLVPHLGNWELMCVFLGHFYTVAALYDPPKVGGLEAEIKAARERFDGKMFAIGVGGMRSVLKELKQGGLVAVLPDQVPDRDAGVYVDFFGHSALTMTLPHQLVSKTQASIIMGSVVREIGDSGVVSYRLHFTELSEIGGSPEVTARLVNRAIEHEIQRAPAQYQWEYKRFKRPEGGGQRNIYRDGGV